MERYKLVTIEPFEKRIPDNVYSKLEDIVWDVLLRQDNPDEFFAPFVFPFENLQKIAGSDNQEYKENIRQMADDVWNQSLWVSALIIYFILLHITDFLPTDFYKFAYVLAKLDKQDEAVAIVELYETLSTNEKLTLHAMANFYYCALDVPQKAVKYFEKFLEIDSSNAVVYNSLGHLYSRLEGANSVEKQISYYQKACELDPKNSDFLKSLLTVYEKNHDEKMVKQLYPKLIELAPTPRHCLNYGLYEFSWGNIQKGYEYFSQRFDLEKYPVGYPKDVLTIANKWNYKDDISDSALLIHYEEGFGDSIMFGRFLPLIRQYAKEVVLVLQPPLVELFKSSKISDGISIYDNLDDALGYLGNKKFVHMPLMDMPFPLGVDTCFIPYTSKYLECEEKSQIDSSKFNIGIAYSGDVGANYGQRDISVEALSEFCSIDGVQMYSLQVGEASKTLQTFPKEVNIIDLAQGFNNFVDSAKAVCAMDLVITTDNVVLNLAGALGVKTFGLFNKYPNYRWFDLTGDNVVWYDSVRPFQCDIEDDWQGLIQKVKPFVVDEVKRKL